MAKPKSFSLGMVTPDKTAAAKQELETLARLLADLSVEPQRVPELWWTQEPTAAEQAMLDAVKQAAAGLSRPSTLPAGGTFSLERAEDADAS